jgi:hypothetical protein
MTAVLWDGMLHNVVGRCHHFRGMLVFIFQTKLCHIAEAVSMSRHNFGKQFMNMFVWRARTQTAVLQVL